MLEVLVSAGTATMIFMGGYTMLQTASHSFDRNERQTSADSDAAMAMSHIMNDMREAQSFLSPSASQIDIILPQVVNGFYDRYASQDPATTPPTISYYLTNTKADGTSDLARREDANRNGVFDGSEPARILCRRVQSITAATDTDLPNALIITLRTKYTKNQNRAETSQEIAQGTAKVTELSQRVVFARNYDPSVNNP
jgi:hypothetical protein